MKKIVSLTILSLMCCSLFSQQQSGITFKLEELEKPSGLLETKGFYDIYKDFLNKDYDGPSSILNYQERRHYIDSLFKNEDVLAHSFGDDKIVNRFEYNPFFFGLCDAYANHRPVILSPDIIWILISQGFDNHINNNSEKFREYIVGFEGKRQLKVTLSPYSKETDWYSIIDSFYIKLASEVKGGLSDVMLCDFSTSDKVDIMVSKVNLMETVKSYYDFLVLYAICGIPEITLTGTTGDWERVKQKTLELEKYDLSWWTKRLIPILDEFIEASKGNVNTDFWKKMVHVDEPDFCGDPRKIDGWMTDFYPYDKDGKRLKGGPITDLDKLPSEIVKVKIESAVVDYSGNTIDKGWLEMWAGFWGLEQDNSTFAIKPKTGWMIRKFDQTSIERELFSRANTPNSFYGIKIATDSVPAILKEFDHIYLLDITFKNKAYLPDWLKSTSIDKLILRGDIPWREEIKANRWFSDVSVNPGRQNIPRWFRRLFMEGKVKD